MPNHERHVQKFSTTEVSPSSAAEAPAKVAAFTPTEGRGQDTALPAEASAKEGELQHLSRSKREPSKPPTLKINTLTQSKKTKHEKMQQMSTTTKHESPISTEWRGAGGEVLAPAKKCNKCQQPKNSRCNTLNCNIFHVNKIYVFNAHKTILGFN